MMTPERIVVIATGTQPIDIRAQRPIVKHERSCAIGGAAVRVSLMQFVTDLTPPPQAVAVWAEGRVFAGLYVPEKTHVPICRQTPWPGGAPLVREFGTELTRHA
jgi:hypothetical protein